MKRSVIFILLLVASFLSFNKLPVNIAYIYSFVVAAISIYWYKSYKGYAIVLLFFMVLFLLGLMIGLNEFSNRYGYINTVYLSSFLFLYSIFIGLQLYVAGEGLSVKQRVKGYQLAFDFLITIMFVDMLLRFTVLSGSGFSFYSYKSSYFYFDSNFSGLVLAAFLMFGVYLKRKNILDLGYLRFLFLLIMLVFTFSRAAIFSVILTYLMILAPKKVRSYIVVVFLFLGVFIVYRMIGFYDSGVSYVNFDGSFNSKFMIMQVAMNYYDSLDSINKFFGIGFANFEMISGIFAHNILVTIFYELGLYGGFLFGLLNFIFYRKLGFYYFYIALPVFLGGFSLFSAYMPFYFCLLSCVYLEEKAS